MAQLTVGDVANVAINIFVLETLATAEDNIGAGPTINMMIRCFCSTVFGKKYADVTEEDIQALDENLKRFAEEYSGEVAI